MEDVRLLNEKRWREQVEQQSATQTAPTKGGLLNRPTPIERDLAVHGGEWTAGPYFLVNTALGHANSDSGNEGATLKSSFPSTSVVNKVGKIKVPFCCWGTKLTAVRATPAPHPSAARTHARRPAPF